MFYLFKRQIQLKKEQNNIFLNTIDKNINEYQFLLTNRYENGTKSKLEFLVVDSTTFNIAQTPPPFNVIEYYIKKDGIKLKPSNNEQKVRCYTIDT